MEMFCYQCEQTAKGTGCTQKGVCGKDSETAGLQDVLIYAVQGIGQYAFRAHALGARDPELDREAGETISCTTRPGRCRPVGKGVSPFPKGWILLSRRRPLAAGRKDHL